MDTKSIEKFSTEARELLLNNMEQRLYAYALDDAGRGEFGVDADVVRGTVLSPVEKGQRAELFRRIEDEGTLPFVSEMAYTWFNRLAAIRYMELRGFLPSHVRMLSTADGSFDPECLHAAATLELPGLERAEVVRLIQAGDDEPLYRAILVAQMNELAGFLPTVFGSVSADALTLPANLLHKSEFNVLYRLVTDIPEESWQNVEILGWMYQFYNSDVKAEFFKSKRKAGADDLAPATQLFTPDWIVRYMVDNSLGRLWMLNHPESSLKNRKADGLMEYYIEPDEEHENFIHVTSPEEITFCDPACGSGHILVYAFQMLMAIYEECGYREREIPELILTKNLSGFEIDPRAAQIATMALAFLAREHDRRFFGREVTADITVLESVSFEEGELPEDSPLAQNKQLTETLAHLGEVGSLFQPSEKDIAAIQETPAAIGLNSLFDASARKKLECALERMEALARHFDVVVANPPYMGSSSFNPFMSKWIKKQYPDSCKDLCTAFIERGYTLACERGYDTMVTMQSWMFLGSFEKMRNRIIDEKSTVTMAHLGPRAFDAIGGEVVSVTADVLYNSSANAKGSYFRLVDIAGSEPKRMKLLEAIQNPNCGWFYRADATAFHDIPGSPIAYWATPGLLKAFRSGLTVKDYAKAKQGLKTGENDRFLRYWWEIGHSKLSVTSRSTQEAANSGKKWFPYNKGGMFRKWYGNREYAVNWENDGVEIKSFYDEEGRLRSRPQNTDSFFAPAITWSLISTGSPSFRYSPYGTAFDAAGSSLFSEKSIMAYLQGALNSTVMLEAASFLSPTLTFEVGQISAYPILEASSDETEAVNALVEELRLLSKTDWDSHETSWDFKRNSLV